MRLCFLLLLATACVAEVDGILLTPPSVGRDASVLRDATIPDATAPRDASVPDRRPPPPPDAGGPTGAEEGEACRSSFVPGTGFAQDNCQPELLCIPWDQLSGRQGELQGPFQTCVRPCTSDQACGRGRACVESGLGDASGPINICVDQRIDDDQYCGFTRATRSVLPGSELLTGRSMLGCNPGATCLRDVFFDLHPSEGVCVTLCDFDAQCPAALPYCNTVFIDGGGGPALGVCSQAQLGPGAFCGSSNGPGLTNRCDAVGGRDLACVQVQGLIPEGEGFCVAACDNNNPCRETEPGLGPYICQPFPGDPNGSGICEIPCSNMPENCEGPGREGAGRMCYDQLSIGGGQPIRFCLDRRRPVLSETLIDLNGMDIAVQGGNCADPNEPLAWARCPDLSFCLTAQPDLGFCFAGCDPNTMPMGCEHLPGTTCVEVMGQPNQMFAVCGQ